MLTIEIQWHYFSLPLDAGSHYSCPLSHYCFMLNNKKSETRIALSYFSIFGLEYKKKNIVLFEISTFEFIKNEFLTNIVNFGIGSTFSKGPGSTFS